MRCFGSEGLPRFLLFGVPTGELVVEGAAYRQIAGEPVDAPHVAPLHWGTDLIPADKHEPHDYEDGGQ